MAVILGTALFLIYVVSRGAVQPIREAVALAEGNK